EQDFQLLRRQSGQRARWYQDDRPQPSDDGRNLHDQRFEQLYRAAHAEPRRELPEHGDERRGRQARAGRPESPRGEPAVRQAYRQEQHPADPQRDEPRERRLDEQSQSREASWLRGPLRHVRCDRRGRDVPRRHGGWLKPLRRRPGRPVGGLRCGRVEPERGGDRSEEHCAQREQRQRVADTGSLWTGERQGEAEEHGQRRSLPEKMHERPSQRVSRVHGLSPSRSSRSRRICSSSAGVARVVDSACRTSASDDPPNARSTRSDSRVPRVVASDTAAEYTCVRERAFRLTSFLSVMICSSLRVVVYPTAVCRASSRASWTSRTVLGPRRHSTLRIASSALVGRTARLMTGKYEALRICQYEGLRRTVAPSRGWCETRARGGAVMNADTQALLDQIGAIKRDGVAVTAGLSDPQFNWQPGPGRWSIAQCLNHLNVGVALVLPAFDRVIAEGRAQGRTAAGPFRYGWFARLIVGTMEPPPKFRMRTPLKKSAGTTHRFADLVPEFARVRDQLAARIQQSDGLDLKSLKITSPVNRLVRLPLGAYFEFIL